MSARLGAIAALGLASCSFGAGLDSARFRCDTATDCPAGQGCEGGFCGSGAMPADAAPTADDDAATCLPADSAADDFSDATGWQAVGGTAAGCTARIEDGRAVILQEEDGAGCGLVSAGRYDLRGANVWIEAVETQEGKPSAGFSIGNDGTGWVGVYREDGLLVLLAHSQGASSTLGMIEFDQDLHIFWGLAIGDTDLEWYTAVDGMNWVLQGMAGLPAGLDPACARFQIRTTGEAGSALDVIMFDNLNQMDGP